MEIKKADAKSIEITNVDGPPRVFTAERPIYSFSEFRSGVLIMLEFELSKLEDQSRNVIYIDSNANLIWTIEAPEDFQYAGEPFKRPDAYAGVQIKDGAIVATTYRGNANEIDPKTGKFVRFLYWSK